MKYVHPHTQKNLAKGHMWKDTCETQQIPLFLLLKTKKQNAVQIKHHQINPNSIRKHRVKLTCTQNLILGSIYNHTIGIYY